jgi:hypothetical protein
VTTPRVIELPRRLEPISRDTFLGAGGVELPVACEVDAPPAVVVALRPRAARDLRRPVRIRRGGSRLRAVADLGPGDPAA